MKSSWVSAAMVSLTIVHVGGAEARTIQVVPDGNDSNSGALDAPKAIVAHGSK
jgi:hypothetical protein